MPAYDYRCETCGNVHEDLVKLKDRDEPQNCPQCGGTATRALITPPRIDWLSMVASPSAGPETLDRYDRMCRAQKEKEERSLAEHGDYGPRPGAD